MKRVSRWIAVLLGLVALPAKLVGQGPSLPSASPAVNSPLPVYGQPIYHQPVQATVQRLPGFGPGASAPASYGVAPPAIEAVPRPTPLPPTHAPPVVPVPPESILPPGSHSYGQPIPPSTTIDPRFGPTLDAPYVVGSEPFMRALWDHGLVLETPHRDFRVRLGGQAQMDSTWFVTDDQLRPSTPGSLTIDPRDSTYLRRGRIRIDGTMYDHTDWAAEYDFLSDVTSTAYLGQPPGQIAATPVPTVTDLYVQFRELPFLQNFRIGNFKEPIGLEHLTSNRWQPFLERSFNQDAFYGPFNNGFSPGAMLFGHARNELATWAVWIGPNTTNPFGYHVGAGQFAVTERLTMLPYYDADGRYLWHVGGSYSFRNPDDQQAQIRARGPIRSGPPGPLNPVYAQTGSLLSDSQQLINAETAVVYGPWTFQGEYTVSFLNSTGNNPLVPPIPEQAAFTGGQFLAHGGYIEALWFLTGEHTPYDRKSGTFGRLNPLQNAYWIRTPTCNAFSRGAWQLAARYSGLNLNDAGLNGGVLNSMTLGVNWYLNPYLKYQFNYDVTDRSAVDQTGAGKVNSFGIRMALDF